MRVARLRRLPASLLSALLWLSAATPAARAQQQPATAQAPARDDEVVRISSDLVRTDVAVLDGGGRFVRGLKAEEFELTVDGRAQPISFFEHVRAGSAEEARLGAAGGKLRSGAAATPPPPPSAAGRAIIFFVDDLHMADHSTARVRKTLLRFVDEQMQEGDQVLIHTTTGQLGFLQQFTGDREVLRAAVNRLAYKTAHRFEAGEWRVPMDEFQALRVEQNDRPVIDFFIREVSREIPAMPPSAISRTRGARPSGPPPGDSSLEGIVRQRARNILQQSAAAARATFRTLENLVRAVAPLPGRKLLFFMSDGFLAEGSWANAEEEMRRVADAAARSGTVIYSIEARGLITTAPEAAHRSGFSLTGLPMTMGSFAATKAQAPLSALASLSGGRALLNSNDLNLGITAGVRETSEYYLLAWQPPGGEGAANRFRRIEVRVRNRPDLNVRVRQGFFEEPPPPPDAAADAKRTPAEKLLDALRSVTPLRQLPTSLGAGAVYDPTAGTVLVASVEVDAQALGLSPGGAARQAELDVAGAVYDLEGKVVAGFEQNLTVGPDAVTGGARPRVVYTQQLKVAPGKYQVRAAARDRGTGRAGSALRWVEVPELKSGRLSLSSIFVGEAQGGGGGRLAPQAEPRFAQGSRLGFLLYIYNPSLAGGRPDVALQVNVLREKEVVVSMPLLRLSTEAGADASRMAYGEEVSLEGLPAGSYVLQVTASDRVGKTHTRQRAPFVIE